MEGKERFELFGEHCIKDNNPDARCQLLDAYVACVILNEQDKENQQLKQQLYDLPKKIVEEIRDNMSKRIMEKQIKWGDNIQIGFICNAINEFLDTILTKYNGE